MFDENEVVALKADKGLIPDAVQEILTELGNPSQAIPFYAIYGPALPEPVTLAGPITPGQVLDAIAQAKGEKAESSQVASNLSALH